MAARAGMVDLISELRRMTQTTVSDYSDDQLQTYLDSYRVIRKRIQVEPIADYVNGAYSYTDYPFPVTADEWIEKSATGSGWALRDSTGATAPTHTVDHGARLITFSVDTGGDFFYLDYRTYDLNLVAAKVWKEKAATAALQVDWKSDNHDIKASQEYDMCIRMAEFYEARGEVGGGVFELYRGDMVNDD